MRWGKGGARMVLKRLRLALGGLLMLGAFLIVLPGAGRLFAQDAPEAPSPQPLRVCSAILTSSTNAVREEPGTDTRAFPDKDTLCEEKQSPYTALCAGLLTDANGNVITAQAYYKSVPEAFAPGDAKT